MVVNGNATGVLWQPHNRPPVFLSWGPSATAGMHFSLEEKKSHFAALAVGGEHRANAPSGNTLTLKCVQMFPWVQNVWVPVLMVPPPTAAPEPQSMLPGGSPSTLEPAHQWMQFSRCKHKRSNNLDHYEKEQKETCSKPLCYITKSFQNF